MSDHFSLLEMDSPSSPRHPAPPDDEPAIELDLVDNPKAPRCIQCKSMRQVNERGICELCANFDHMKPTIDAINAGFSATEPTLVADLTAIASQGQDNAAVKGIGSMRGGELRSVGFTSAEGYITAIRNGVPARTHAEYIVQLRTRFGLTSAAIESLKLPRPMAETALPVGAGITHTPTGPSVFDKPKADRAFVVGPKADVVERIDYNMAGKELVAGAVAEGHHAIVAWEGTSGMTRGQLVDALRSIEREAWAPKAPNARAQAGSAIAALGRGGLDVKSLRKGNLQGSGLESGEHIWTVGRIGHASNVGDAYGNIVCRFKLSGSQLTFFGDDAIATPVLADFAARMSSELFKSSDVTSWLSRTIRNQLDGVRFGALGWLVPARHVAAAKQLCEAVSNAGFGTGWVTGLPVATSDQLRDGIVRGLITEVDEVVNAIAAARETARLEKLEKRAAAEPITGVAGLRARDAADALPGDIGHTRAATYLKELRTIAARVVAYGQVLGEERVDRAQRVVREAMISLENVLGEDYSGIRERFAQIWDEIELDRKRTGGVL